MRIIATKDDRVLIYDNKSPGLILEYTLNRELDMRAVIASEFWNAEQIKIIERLMR